QPLEMPIHVLRDVGVCDHRVDALHRLGLRGVQLYDFRVVVRRPECLDPQRLADPDVIDVLRTPGDVTDAVVTGEPCTDGLHAGLPFGWTSGSPAVASGTSATTVDSPREAASTASTIFT